MREIYYKRSLLSIKKERELAVQLLSTELESSIRRYRDRVETKASVPKA